MKSSFKNKTQPNSPNRSIKGIFNQPAMNYALERKKTI